MAGRAVISDDHANPQLSAAHLVNSQTSTALPRIFSAAEINEHNAAENDSFWAVVDGFVVEASAFLKGRVHPGGARKLKTSNDAKAGHTGSQFGFSFSKGHNAHFPETGRRWREGVEEYLRAAGKDDGNENLLPAMEVAFAPHGSITIIGRFGR